MDLAATMQEALRLHQTGRRAGAEALYRDILAVEPRYAPALFILGISRNADWAAGRAGAILRAAGLGDLIAQDEDSYVALLPVGA